MVKTNLLRCVRKGIRSKVDSDIYDLGLNVGCRINMNVKSMLSAPLTTEQKAQLLQQIMMHCLELQFQFNCTAAAGI